MFTGKMTGKLFRGRRPAAERAGALPVGPTLEARWDEAFLRVESYLHAHGIQSPLTVNRIATRAIQDARAAAKLVPDPEPVALAIATLHNAMAQWYRTVLQEPDLADEAVRAKGRLSLVMTRNQPGWAQQFLAADPIHPDLAAGLREAELRPGPEVQLTNMPPAPLEFAINPSEKEKSDAPGFRGHGLIQAAALWVLVLGALGAAWAASH
jgi:hypothetical protein